MFTQRNGGGSHFCQIHHEDEALSEGVTVLRHAAVIGTGQPRVYGEMVNDLWQDGNPQAASHLEGLWNALLEEYHCTLFCGYVLDAFDLRSYDGELEGLCGAHADIEPTQSDRKVRLAIDEACLQVLGIHLSSILRHSQSECDAWHARLPPARRAIFWLKTNAPSRLGQVLGLARDLYGQSPAGLDA